MRPKINGIPAAKSRPSTLCVCCRPSLLLFLGLRARTLQVHGPRSRKAPTLTPKGEMWQSAQLHGVSLYRSYLGAVDEKCRKGQARGPFRGFSVGSCFGIGFRVFCEALLPAGRESKNFRLASGLPNSMFGKVTCPEEKVSTPFFAGSSKQSCVARDFETSLSRAP